MIYNTTKVIFTKKSYYNIAFKNIENMKIIFTFVLLELSPLGCLHRSHALNLFFIYLVSGRIIGVFSCFVSCLSSCNLIFNEWIGEDL